MNFLVILICLTVNYLWLKDFDRFDDGWFVRFRCRVEDLTANLAEKMPMGWLPGIVLLYAIPLALLAALLFITGDSVFGLATMMVHILVLLAAFDRTQPGKLANDFLDTWKAGDTEACAEFLRQRLNATGLPEAHDKEALGRFFSKQLIYRSFEKMFVMVFWYMCTGALGILFCYLSYQLQDSHREGQLQKQRSLVDFMIRLVEWIPVRLLALTFSLAGNFVRCFENVRKSFWKFDVEADNAELLYGYASCAIAGMVRTDELESAQDAGSLDADSPDTESLDREGLEIQALLGLLERSQTIWLGVLALIAILGL